MVPTFITNPKFDLVQYQQMRQTGCSAPLWWVTCSSITTHWTISNWWGSTTLGRTQLRTRGEHASFSYPVPRGWGPNEGCDHSQSFAVCQVGSGYENEALIVYELAISNLPMCRLFYFSESISEHLSNSWSSFDMLENIRQCCLSILITAVTLILGNAHTGHSVVMHLFVILFTHLLGC